MQLRLACTCSFFASPVKHDRAGRHIGIMSPSVSPSVPAAAASHFDF